MERILMLAIAFLMGFVFIICPLPPILTYDAFYGLGAFLKNILSLFGYIVMIYCSIEVVIKLYKSRR